ncbi:MULTISPECIES: acyltransferase [Bacteroides]|uniref:acyltransferase n=1 Tax=Bacteroides TaxID=816 RepID=UPI00189E06F2|nr:MULTISPECIES: acyltransferase [Bacteroides]MDC1767443.1 acyltransferase [Bacteroides uniformis]MDC1771067.1 acyltransferase [Bacteroides uniformis]MDC1777305.1 acyltransferase [Bacteroides uniformis]MDC1778797.1 acyltransferase [Bacteroides uniformis]
MRYFINRAVSQVKKEPFTLDELIPLNYLITFFLKKFVMLIYGLLRMRTLTRVFIHPSTHIYCIRKIKYNQNLSIDRNCYIDALSVDGINLGSNVSIGKNTTIECTGTLKSIGKGLTVGNNVGLGTHGFFGCAGGITIGDNTIFGNYVSLHSENHNYDDIHTPIRLQGVNRKGIKIGKDCWIGTKATILDGTEIGDGCIVAAGAVVRGMIEPYSIVGGVPAKLIKRRK